MGLILTFIATILLFILAIPSLLVGIIISLFSHRGDRYFKDIAISIDMFGNVLCQHLFNITLIQKSGYKFGKFGETISSVIGKNKRDNNLSKIGKILDKILDLCDKNHSLDAINDKIS